MDIGVLYNTIGECWKPIKDFPAYLISNRGRVWSLNRKERWGKYYRTRQGRFLVPRLGSHGYLYVGLCKGGRVYTKKIHRLVAENFLPNPYGYDTVNHKDEDRTNNSVENLEWCTTAYNVTYGRAILKRKSRLIDLGCSKSVVQYDKNGDFIGCFSSIGDAARSIGKNPGAICMCCKGIRKIAYGYIWKYKK